MKYQVDRYSPQGTRTQSDIADSLTAALTLAGVAVTDGCESVTISKDDGYEVIRVEVIVADPREQIA